MIYDSIFAKSFSRYEQKRFGYGAFVAFLLVLLSFCTVFKPYLGPIHDLNLKLSIGVDTKMLMVNDTTSSLQLAKVEDIVAKILVENIISSSPHKNEAEGFVPKSPVNDTKSSPQIVEVKDNGSKIHINNTGIPPPKAEVEEIETRKMKQLCVSEERTEYCQTQGDIRVHGKSSSVYTVSHKTAILAENMSRIIRPYARKDDIDAMTSVRKWSVKPLKASQQVPQCTKNHSIPAVIFSTAGYTGNHFHEFTDILIPLFLTCRQFNGQVQLIITDKRPWWIFKHQAFLNKLSNHEIMDTDRDDGVHCFPRVIVGLKRYQKELSIDPQKYSYSIKDFKNFLRSSYALKRVNAIKIGDGQQNKKPRLLILTRKRSRSFINTAQIAKMAKGLGFKVIVMEAGKNLWSFANIVNSCDVLLGVHGAGLTNILFLPENATFIQVVPYGGSQMEWLAKNDFAKPSEGMNIKYLEYKIGLQESTLIKQYPLDHTNIKDPPSVEKQGWEAYRSVYLDKQNVNLDINRFRPTLQKALELLHQ